MKKGTFELGHSVEPASSKLGIPSIAIVTVHNQYIHSESEQMSNVQMNFGIWFFWFFCNVFHTPNRYFVILKIINNPYITVKHPLYFLQNNTNYRVIYSTL